MVDSIHLDLSDLTEQIKETFQHWDKPYREENSLVRSLLFKEVNPSLGHNPRGALNKLLLSLLDDFQGDEILFADTLRMRYADGRTVRETANFFNVEEGTIQKRQAAGWEEAARIFEQREATLRSQIRQRLVENLEIPTYTQLWGVDEHIQSLTELITDPDGPQIIAIEGIGGIGKTSLTNALMRHLIESNVIGHGQFEGCAWVTARDNLLTVAGEQKALPQASLSGAGLINGLVTQLFAEEGRPFGLDTEQMLSMITHRLAEESHLIVIDNLETVSDTDSLIETLRQLVGPTRILLTTRYNLFSHPDVYHYPIGELRQDDALSLIRHEAKQRNLAMLAGASAEDLTPIYKTVGGNPLALRLVVGQTHIHALGDVLKDLAEAQGKPIENLYIYIYWHAWKSLDESAREAWLLMPLVNGSGMTVHQLAEFSEMETGDLRHALHQLVTLNLIEHHGDLVESRYYIHSLTRSFLQGQVLRWGVGEESIGLANQL